MVDTNNPVRARIADQIAQRHAQRLKREEERPAIEAVGMAALVRLYAVAQSDTGQSRRVGLFLLGLYNGPRFPFDLTNLRALDAELFDDCLALLRMDQSPEREIHRYFVDGSDRFERLAKRWGRARDED